MWVRKTQASVYPLYSGQLKSLDRMKNAFLSVVGHELKTPLTVIVGGLEFMNDPEKSGMPPEIVDAVKKGAAKLEEIE